nr:immunoglobulin light chain junction region [Macaca mulatta]MOV72978.1 immunoglobulin light chain junction region [Macaca mulatta]MOV72991.1 immunoglobulin light chain junction region [Macaca mulatta]MOV73379.1 immunoglobulin light chain junction region [Macaca mulatta]MOV73393.1 immunoglobulin light chain junction region [Macaca mulatta]
DYYCVIWHNNVWVF